MYQFKGFPGGASGKKKTQCRRHKRPRFNWVRSLGREDPLEEGMATSILAWRIPWTKEPGGLQSSRSQRVGHEWSDLALTGHTGMKWAEVRFKPGRQSPVCTLLAALIYTGFQATSRPASHSVHSRTAAPKAFLYRILQQRATKLKSPTSGT